MVVKMFAKLRRMDNRNFNKEIEKIREYQTEVIS